MEQAKTSLKVRSISIFIALLFALNLLSVIPTSENHPKDNGVTHTLATEFKDLSHSQEKQAHDHLENCGMASCTIALSDFFNVGTSLFNFKAQYLMMDTKLDTLHHAPPGRPPLV
jgi:hypothetical protein